MVYGVGSRVWISRLKVSGSGSTVHGLRCMTKWLRPQNPEARCIRYFRCCGRIWKLTVFTVFTVLEESGSLLFSLFSLLWKNLEAYCIHYVHCCGRIWKLIVFAIFTVMEESGSSLLSLFSDWIRQWKQWKHFCSLDHFVTWWWIQWLGLNKGLYIERSQFGVQGKVSGVRVWVYRSVVRSQRLGCRIWVL